MTEMECLVQVSRLVGTVRFFPVQEEAIDNIVRETVKFADKQERLALLVDAFINEVGEWRGLKEFRGVWCTRWKPADGISADSTIFGFTATDSEAGSGSRALIEPEIKASALERGKEAKYLPLPPEEIKENRELIAKVDYVAKHRHELPHEKGYESPEYLRNL